MMCAGALAEACPWHHADAGALQQLERVVHVGSLAGGFSGFYRLPLHRNEKCVSTIRAGGIHCTSIKTEKVELKDINEFLSVSEFSGTTNVRLHRDIFTGFDNIMYKK